MDTSDGKDWSDDDESAYEEEDANTEVWCASCGRLALGNGRYCWVCQL